MKKIILTALVVLNFNVLAMSCDKEVKLTKREYFAIRIAAAATTESYHYNPKKLAKYSIERADVLLKALEKKK